MANITLKQAAAWCGGQIDKKYENVTFAGANIDSRKLQPGQLFVALVAARDGHDFIPGALEKGASAVLCNHADSDFPAIVGEDTRIALGQIAAGLLQQMNPKIIGVTGSVGKSTTKEMVATVLESTYRIAKTPANHNNDIGMPMAILAMSEDTEVAVLEMGMNHFREMAYLSSVARPDIAVIVNIGTMHIEHLGSVEGIRRAKLEILEGMAEEGQLILNGDDGMLSRLPETPVQTVTYFGTGENSGVRAENIRESEGLLEFDVSADRRSFHVEMALEGLHFVPDALAAVAVGLMLQVEPVKIQERLSMFRNMSGRQEIWQKNGYTIINDCYNAGPESMAAALTVLGKKKGRRVAVLGDMLELGDNAWAEHYRIGRIAAENAELILAYGPNAGRVIAGAVTGGKPQSMALAYENRDSMTSALKRMAKPGDILLFKGSRGMHLELVLNAFLEEEK